MANQNGRKDQLATGKQLRHDQSFKTLTEHCTKEELGTVLGVSDDPRIITLVTYLLSPNRDLQRRSLANLASMCDLSYSELLRAVTSSRVSEGLLRMSKKVPEMMANTVDEALTQTVPCDSCKGTGQVIVKGVKRKPEQDTLYEDCWKCSGTGKVKEAGSQSARALVFETMGMTNRKTSLFNINVGSAPGELPTIENEMAHLGKVLDMRPTEKT